MVKIVEIMAIGDELTSGQRLDTNSQYLSQRLGEMGLEVRFHTTVGDVLEDNVRAFREAARRADVIVVTGGLGPTADDLTRESISEAFDLPLELRPEALAHIEALFALRKRPMPERNRVQAFFPQTSRMIHNPHGTAPGIDVEVKTDLASDRRCRIFALPGVPAEMQEMLDATVLPALREALGGTVVPWRHRVVKVFGIGESDVEKTLPNLIARDRIPRVGITVSQATISLRIVAQSETEEAFEQEIAPTLQEIREGLGLLIFGEGDVELHEVVHEMLLARSIRLALVEVGAGCHIAPLLASLSTMQDNAGLCESGWFPSLARLRQTLDVDTGHDAEMSVETVLQQAAERGLHGAGIDACLAVGVYPSKADVEASRLIPYTDFTMCLARRQRPTKTTTVSLGGHPDVIYHRLAKTAIHFLRLEYLRG